MTNSDDKPVYCSVKTAVQRSIESVVKEVIESYNQVADVDLKGLSGVNRSKEGLVCTATLSNPDFSVWDNGFDEVYIEIHQLGLMFKTIW